jgi:signal transduction histidine kinase
VRLRQVLTNRLSNAVKFTPDGGTVRITGDVKAGMVQVGVIDSGIGIAPQNLEKAFQPFVQIESALGRKQTGTGLGLQLARLFVESHGGHLWAESTPGQGSAFYLTLPVSGGTGALPELTEPA